MWCVPHTVCQRGWWNTSLVHVLLFYTQIKCVRNCCVFCGQAKTDGSAKEKKKKQVELCIRKNYIYTRSIVWWNVGVLLKQITVLLKPGGAWQTAMGFSTLVHVQKNSSKKLSLVIYILYITWPNHKFNTAIFWHCFSDFDVMWVWSPRSTAMLKMILLLLPHAETS